MFLRVKSSSLTRVQQRRTASRAFSATASGLAVPGRRPVVTLVSSWFCPFAQRAWIALNHRGIAYDWVEALDWNADGSYKKAPVLLAHNPQGLVPTIIGRHGSGEVVTESSICVEFADDFAAAFPDDSSSSSSNNNNNNNNNNNSNNAPLLPADPFLRARARLAVEWVNKSLCSPYYAVLVRRDWDERRAAFDALLDALREFSAECEANRAAVEAEVKALEAGKGGARGREIEQRRPGPFYLGGDQLSAVDVELIPWACRYYAIDHYRSGLGHGNFSIPTDDPTLEPFHRWCAAAFALPSVAPTIPDRQRYIDHVIKYADGSAQSKVGDAVRAGRPAHELKID